MVSIENLEKDLNSKDLEPMYLIYGEEHYLIDTIVKKIRKKFGKNVGEIVKGINYILIDDTNIQELISDIETPAFGFAKKLIIVKNTNLFKSDGKRKNSDIKKYRDLIDTYIKNNFNIIKEAVILVFLEESADSRLALYKTVDKNGIICKIDFQKPIQLERRIARICSLYKVKIDNQTVRYFVETVGTNMQDLVNEIRKLIEYVGENGTIKKQDIDLLSTKKMEAIIFDLTDNLGKKDTGKALDILRNLIYNKEPIQKILITLYNHFKRLYFTQIAVLKNKDMVTSLDLKPNQVFLVNKYKMQARYFKTSELREILQQLCDLDYNYKNGLIDLQIGLEAILCRYC